jgi:hypothetical protein
VLHEAGIVLLLLLCYAYVFPRWADWNQNSRFDLTVAIVDHGTLAIDCCVDNTGDYARIGDRSYSDKAPGLSLLAVPVHALFAAAGARGGVLDRAVQGAASGAALAPTLRPEGSGLLPDKVRFALALTVATVCVVALPSALFGAVFFRFLVACGARVAAALAATLLYGLGTIACVYAGAFYAHQLVAALSFAAFALVAIAPPPAWRPWRLIAVGLLLGLAVISEYPAALIAAVVVGFAAARVGLARGGAGLARVLGWIGLGAAGPLVALVVYDLAVFGTPLPVGYRYSALWQARHQIGFMSLSTPSAVALWGITLSPYRGLFFLSPILTLAIPGFIAVLRRPRLRAPGIASALVVAAFLVFNASSVMWWGGFSIGPRYVVPMLPFLAWPVAFALEGIGARAGGRLVIGGLGFASLIGVWGLRLAGQQFPEERWRAPWIEYAWPRLRDGDLARNVGMLVGLRGWWSLLPLVLAGAVLAAAWWRLARRRASHATG